MQPRLFFVNVYESNSFSVGVLRALLREHQEHIIVSSMKFKWLKESQALFR